MAGQKLIKLLTREYGVAYIRRKKKKPKRKFVAWPCHRKIVHNLCPTPLTSMINDQFPLTSFCVIKFWHTL